MYFEDVRGFGCECQNAGNLRNMSRLEILGHDFFLLCNRFKKNKLLLGMSVQGGSLQNLAAAIASLTSFPLSSSLQGLGPVEAARF